MTAIAYPHIVIDGNGMAWVEGTRVKVLEIVWEKLARNWSADDLHDQHPHLSLAQIYAALAYYYDHRDEIDHEIEQEQRYIDEMRTRLPESPFARRLRSEHIGS